MFNTLRCPDIPGCLNDERYNVKEVVDLLEPMFHGKCYLCEQDELTDPEIEHFDPHRGETAKKYDWNNLYYSCGRCNSIKSYTHTNLLDCCAPDVDVFRRIKCSLPSNPDDPIKVEAVIDPNDVQTTNTVELIDKCYNQANTPLRGITRSVLMEKLFEHYTAFLTYRSTIRNKRSTEDERNHAKNRIVSMLSDSFPFSVFWKWHVLSDTRLHKHFEGEINF